MEQKNIKGFASDNNSGIHPDVLKAISAANTGHAVAYGDDPYTQAAVDKFKALFGENIEVFFVFNGTGANVLGLNAATASFNSIVCAETAHINVDECSAPEKFTGCKLLFVPTGNGKLTVAGIKKHLHGFGFEHHAQPKVISITQSTEMGTVYTPEEIKEIVALARKNEMLLHMDGARLANAAASLDMGLQEISLDLGVDILSFGGTKNGMMFGEAVVFADKSISSNFKYIRKQGMQLASKMRFIAAQFDALLSNGLWLKNARHSNKMARLLASEVENVHRIRITQAVEANGIFAVVPKEYITELQDHTFFYIWDEEKSEVRWMTSFDTTAEDIYKFADLLKTTIER